LARVNVRGGTWLWLCIRVTGASILEGKSAAVIVAIVAAHFLTEWTHIGIGVVAVAANVPAVTGCIKTIPIQVCGT
jgi:hypothetical protein